MPVSHGASVSFGKRKNLESASLTSSLLAIESMRRFQELKEESVEADRALRNSLELLPISHARISHQGYVFAVAFSADGKYLATASGNTAHISEVTTGTEIARISPKVRKDL